jgi:holo-[acyl-carrier protein] synthase
MKGRDGSHQSVRRQKGPGTHERKALKALIFGIGTDIIEVRRVGDKLARTKRLKEKVFTPREIEYCEARRMSAQHFAVRFSAKEAFLKAMGTGWSGGSKFDEIEVLNDALGKPELFVHGKVKEFCEAHGITGMEVSLSHIKDLAQAVVVLETKSKE